MTADVSAAKGALDLSALRDAVARAPDNAKMHYDLSDALAAAGDAAGSAAMFRRAYIINPVQRPALSRDETIPLAIRAAQLRERALSLIQHGVTYASVIGALAVADGILGHRDDVAKLYDYDRFVRCDAIAAPEGFAAKDFHAALASESMADLEYYNASKKVAFQQGWRNLSIASYDSAAFNAFRGQIRTQIDAYIARLPRDTDNPFLAARPDEYMIDSWAVVSNGASHHLPHMHPRAWMTGVYYVERPAVSRVTGTDRGWLRLSPPRRAPGAEENWLTRMIEPEPGNLLLMPGYFIHESLPVDAAERRICIAFDVRPTELRTKLAHPGVY
ncbi:MAG TPA: putative 2OG-Fe(II) oxygenase [Rhizomicrobium sp.]|jgi:uncharacterized protein (TIGR02466 family)|nr:putative 2OG-Fe(II) oxygenase [Rhizomicrobium sp.]